MEEEELRWKQCAHEDWLAHGDKNSKFFDACVNQKRCTNQLSSVINDEGVTCTCLDLIENAFISYFRGILSTSQPSGEDVVLGVLTRRITEEQNQILVKEVTMEEVCMALNQMAHLKAPGPDGFPAGFYQENWAAMGE